MTIDFTGLTAGHIALLTAMAGVTAATIGGFVALVVAWVNSRAALRVARFNARTAYRQRMCQPALDALERDIAYYDEMCAVLQYGDEEKAREWYRKNDEFHHLDKTPLGVQVLWQNDAPLKKAFEDVQERRNALDSSFSILMAKYGMGSAKTHEVYEKATRMLAVTVKARAELDRVVFE